MPRSPEPPGLEGFLSAGFSEVPEEIARRVGETYGISCTLYVMDIDGTLLHPLAQHPTSGYPGSVGWQAKDPPGPISLVDGEQTPGRVVFEREVLSCSREEWIGQAPLEEEYLTTAPVRAADATTGMLVVGSSEPLEESLVSTLRSMGFQAGAALALADEYSDVLVTARRRGRLSLAAEMQQDLLPPGEMHDSRVGVAGGIEPAYDIGGDFYDYALRDGHLYVALGDPSGKGLPAEILAAVCFAATRNARRDGEDLPGIMMAAHRAMREVSAPDQYCTMLLAEIDLATHEAQLLIAGHPAPLYIPGIGSVSDGSGSDGSGSDGSGSDGSDADSSEAAVLAVTNVYPPVGALDQEEDYRVERHRLQAGSRLLLYSDGITERGDSPEEMMGTEGLARYARENHKLGVLPFVRGLLSTVSGYANKPIADDATVVLLDFNGS